MTHDELLAKIDSNLSDCGYDCESCKRDNASWVALRAVVELHKPYMGGFNTLLCESCTAFADWVVEYPCPTIQAIEKELK